LFKNVTIDQGVDEDGSLNIFEIIAKHKWISKGVC
jgi:hypothetical protein